MMEGAAAGQAESSGGSAGSACAPASRDTLERLEKVAAAERSPQRRRGQEKIKVKELYRASTKQNGRLDLRRAARFVVL